MLHILTKRKALRVRCHAVKLGLPFLLHLKCLQRMKGANQGKDKGYAVYPRYNGPRHTGNPAVTDALSKMSTLHQSPPAITDHRQNTGPDAFLEILIPAPIQIISSIPDSCFLKKISPVLCGYPMILSPAPLPRRPATHNTI